MTIDQEPNMAEWVEEALVKADHLMADAFGLGSRAFADWEEWGRDSLRPQLLAWFQEECARHARDGAPLH